MKRISILMLVLTIVFGATTLNVNYVKAAADEPIIENEMVLDINDSTKDFTEENNFYYTEGKKSLTKSESLIQPMGTVGVQEEKWLSMVHYYQNGQSWSGNIMQTCGYTIGSQGCALTSFSMVTDYYGYSDNPGEVNTRLGSYACPLAWSSAGQRYNLDLVGSVHTQVSSSYAKDYIRGALRNNRPVIVGFIKGSSTHFVVARAFVKETYQPELGFYGNEYFYIHDPYSGRNYKFIDDYLDAGYSIHRLKVYDN